MHDSAFSAAEVRPSAPLRGSHGGRAPRLRHRIATNFAEYLGTSGSCPVTSLALEELMSLLSQASADGRKYAVVSKRCSTYLEELEYAATALEVTPDQNGVPVNRLYRATHPFGIKWRLTRLAQLAGGAVVHLGTRELFRSETLG